MDLNNVSAELRMNRPSSSSNSPVGVPISWAKDKDAMDAARILSILGQGGNLEMETVLPMQILPASIGVQCAKYESILEMPGKNRMQCGNPACATRRHRQEVRASANMVCSWIQKEAPGEIMSCEWVHLEGCPEIKLTGFDIRRRLLWQEPLDPEMADALICLLRELEDETMARRKNLPGRHYVSPHWGVNIAQGNSCMDTSYDLFVSTTPPHVLRRCTIVLTLACSNGSKRWSCYAFDLTRRIISIMDPSGQHPLDEARVLHHAEVAKGMLPHVLYCMRRATGNYDVGRGSWTPKLMLGRGMKHPMKDINSGIQAINCMRWYNGETFCEPPTYGQSVQTRRGLIFQLLSMDGNQASTKAINEAYNFSQENKKARREDAD